MLSIDKNERSTQAGIEYDRISTLVGALAKLSKSPAAQLLYYGYAPSNNPGNHRVLAVMGRPAMSEIEWHYADFPRVQSQYPSLAKHWPAVIWTEREMWEQARVLPTGHPDLRPILNPHTSRIQGVAHGDGVFHLPLGPVRGDVAESAFYLFDTIGEQIMHMQPQLFYKHRDIEHLAIGLPVQDALLLSERVSGTSTIAHATAFSRAVEQALGSDVHLGTELERTILSELERLYNHAHDFSQIAGATGMTVAQAQFARVKEEFLRLNADVTGSRYLRNAIQPNLPSSINWGATQDSVLRCLEITNDKVQRLVHQLLKTPTFVDRLQPTGIVTEEWARAYNTVGPVARACGLSVDTRQDYLPWYQDLDYIMAWLDSPTGDALSRFLIRVQEWSVSQMVIRRCLHEVHSHDSYKSVYAEAPLSRTGIGLSESPRGRVAHIVQLDSKDQISFWSIRSASAWNWPVFGLATANGNIQTDFPIIESSFGLSCAGIDR